MGGWPHIHRSPQRFVLAVSNVPLPLSIILETSGRALANASDGLTGIIAIDMWPCALVDMNSPEQKGTSKCRAIAVKAASNEYTGVSLLVENLLSP